MAYQAPRQPAPGASIAAMRDRLDWQALNGMADAMEGRSLNPPKMHRAERRVYVSNYVAQLDAQRAYEASK